MAAMVFGMYGSVSVAGVSDVGLPPAPVEAPQPPDHTPEERQRPATDREMPTSQNNSTRNQARSVLKCWQYGKLIVEERDWMPGKRSNLPGPVLHARGGRFDSLQLGDFGETFCFLKSNQ